MSNEIEATASIVELAEATEMESVENEKVDSEVKDDSDHCSEDNLHGLSITPRSNEFEEKTENEETAEKEMTENVEDLNLSDLSLQNNRVNPFNSPKGTKPHTQLSGLTSPSHKPGENLLPLENFTQIDEKTVEQSEDLENVTDQNKNEAKPTKWDLEHLDLSPARAPGFVNPDLSVEQEQNYVTNDVTPSDPWVKLETTSGEPQLAESQNIPNDHTPEKTDEFSSHSKHFELMPPKSKVKEAPEPDPEEKSVSLNSFVIDVPGPCEPEDLIEGIIFSANYLGTTQLTSERNPAKNTRMFQAQEAVNRIKAPEGESQPTVQVDLFISTSKLKILNSDTQETMMEHTLRSISYIADVGDLLVVMAKRLTHHEPPNRHDAKPSGQQRIICHVLSSPDSHLMAESIGQCFQVAYQQFLQSNCIEPQSLTQADYNNILDTQDMYHDDLVHYSKQENAKEIWVEKKKGESMGVAIVESGWGSIIPTVILANLQHGSPIERNGKFGIGDQIMSINNMSLVGLPLATCQSIIKGLRNQTLVKIKIVSCPPVVTVLIKRPDLQHQLGFSVQNGIICSLMRGGIAERGGVRVGHRIIEINSQSVVATPHDKIVQMLVTSVGEIQMKTMPAAMYRLLTGQEQPLYL